MELEYRTEPDSGVNLTTGERWSGIRVHYRRAGERRWSRFLLSVSDGSEPDDAMVRRAIAEHAATRPSPSRGGAGG